MDKVQVEAIIKPLECVRGLLQPNFVYFQLKVKGASREEVIQMIKGSNCAISLPEIDVAIMKSDLLETDEPIDLQAPIR